MRFVLATALLAVSIQCLGDPGDTLKRKPLRYVFSINSSMSFCTSCTQEGSLVAMPTTIHGIQYKNLRLGGGIGYTAFGQIRMMPYFGSLTFNFFGAKVKNGFFVQWDYGTTHAWTSNNLYNNQFLKRVSGANFLQVSTGYAYHYHKLRLAAQVGYQSLKTSTVYEYAWIPYYNFIGYVPPPPANVNQEVEIRRFFLSLSFGL
ncbi:MAG TPA: hypothetical protein VFE50_22820 [Cyclobacteriaceae bacterium]|nr:hypothetical protein [Cyclobacteriaceae bacterium]